ncbi:MAG: DUF5993 family protein [Methyloceanibacter sp.]|nr:DUF5993 family protein [Methyloceanibacter sp.]
MAIGNRESAWGHEELFADRAGWVTGGLVHSVAIRAPFALAIIRIFHKSPARFIMMSLPFVLFACGLGAAWLRQRAAAMGFWVAGLVILLVLFRAHYGDALSIAL